MKEFRHPQPQPCEKTYKKIPRIFMLELINSNKLINYPNPRMLECFVYRDALVWVYMEHTRHQVLPSVRGSLPVPCADLYRTKYLTLFTSLKLYIITNNSIYLSKFLQMTQPYFKYRGSITGSKR